MKTGLKHLHQKQQDGQYIAIYCAGQHGILFSEILKQAGIKTDAFFDRDSNKWGKEITDGVSCLNPYTVVDKDAYQVFICIASPYYRETEQNVRDIGFQNIVSLNDIFNDIILNHVSLYLDLIRWDRPVSKVFYISKLNRCLHEDGLGEKVRSGKIAVYTGIFGDYDAVCQPRIIPENIDYYFVSDRKPENIGVFRWLDARTVIPPDITTPVKRNRYIKMHPHLLFPEYQYSIYLDGNVAVEKDIASFIRSSFSGIAAFMHPERDCIFYEALTVVNCQRVTADDVCRQMERYLEEGMPLHYGLPAMGVMAREHHKQICVKLMEDWWKEFDIGAQRDQLSFMYVMWKNGMGLSDMASLGNDVYGDERISFRNHVCASKALF